MSMSRVIVKNLPKKVNEDELRSIFSTKGAVTDIQLKYTPEGKFRNFAYIGYDTEKEANKAIKHLNATYIKTCKISVEPCIAFDDRDKTKALSKHSIEKSSQNIGNGQREGSEENYNGENTNNDDKRKKKKNKKKDRDEELLQVIEKYKDDPLFEEFLEVHNAKEVNELKKKIKSKKKESKQEISDKVIDDVEKGDDVKSEDEEEPVTKLACEEISDADYFKKLKTKSSTETKEETKKIEKVKKEKAPKEKIKLYTLKLRGLPAKCKKRSVKDFFRPNLPYTIRFPRGVSGICYVGFKTEKQMKLGLNKHKSFMDGAQIFVTSHEVQNHEENQDDDDPRKKKWKQQEESLKEIESIGESGRIFVRNLTYTLTEDDLKQLFSEYGLLTEVTVPIDESTQMNKGFGLVTFVAPEDALKAFQALDRTTFHGRLLHLLPGKGADDNKEPEIDDTMSFKKKKALKEKREAGLGHNWNSLFLGANAVADATAEAYGTTKSAVIGPHSGGNIAVRMALAETKLVLEMKRYLEKQGVVLEAFDAPPTKRSDRVLLVKRLPFGVEVKELAEMFEKFGNVLRIILPPHGLTAVVEFSQPSQAREAFKRLAFSKFKNSILYLEWAPENSLKEKCRSGDVHADMEEVEGVKSNTLNNNDGDTEEKEQGFRGDKSQEIHKSDVPLKNDPRASRKPVLHTKQTGSKLLVRNVPFQAKVKDLAGIFRVYGETKSIRLPKRMTGSGESEKGGPHRGFAFVEYVSASDAKKAYDELRLSTHLFGRRLVLEWAAPEEGLEGLRKRTAEHFGDAPTNHTQKKAIFSID